MSYTPPSPEALRYRLQQLDTEIAAANRARSGAALGILIAIIGTLVFVPLIPLWALIGIAGLLAWGTNASKANVLKKERASVMASLGI